MTPGVGRVVHYAGPGSPVPACLAAIVTGVTDDTAGILHLTVFGTLGETYPRSVKPDPADNGAPSTYGTWHLPEWGNDDHA